MNTICDLVLDRSGASTAEYAVLIALIAVGVIGALKLLREEFDSVVTSAASGLGAAK